MVTGKGKYLFVHKVVPGNTQKKTSHAANSKLFIKIFFMHIAKYVKDNNPYLVKSACIFVLGDYLFFEAHSLPKLLSCKDVCILKLVVPIDNYSCQI